MRIPDDGEVKQWQVLEWVQEQARYLEPTQHHLLMYLCINAFYTPNNPEGGWVGRVLMARSQQPEIQYRTGWSRRTITNSLEALEAQGYITYVPGRGNRPSEITVMWSETCDDIRDRVRAGTMPLPRQFRREKTTPKWVIAREEEKVVDIRDRLLDNSSN